MKGFTYIRLVIFTTDSNLKHLSKSEAVYCDGTFNTAPKIFKQVYIIMGTVFGAVVPLVLALTTHKDTQTYTTILTEIKGKKKGPKFHFPKWNIYELMRKGDPKTNNYSESFNHKFSHMIGQKTGVFPFMEQLRKEQHHTELAMSGKVPGKHRKQEEHVPNIEQTE